MAKSKNISLRLSIYLNYFVFALILNSVGILIARSMNAYGVDELEASSLEAFKDLSIAIVSFLVGSFLPRLGYKRGILIGLGLVFIGCLGLYFGNSFGAVQILFACTGIAFAIVKVSVYALIGILSDDKKELNTLLSTVESVFMLGIACAYVLFPLFYSETDPNAWLDIYILIAALVAFSWVFVFFSDFDIKNEIPGMNIKDDFMQMIGLLKTPLIFVFAISAFMYVMMEQGIMSWLPTFNEQVLNLPEKTSVNMAVILALSIAAGRYISGQLVKKITWVTITQVCLIAAALVVIFVLPLTKNVETGIINSLSDVPIIAFVFPLIGLFLAPIYPLMNAAVLGATDKSLHSPMAGLLTFFSALGGTIGSRLVGYLFQKIGGADAFYFSIGPILILFVTLILLYKFTRTKEVLK